MARVSSWDLAVLGRVVDGGFGGRGRGRAAWRSEVEEGPEGGFAQACDEYDRVVGRRRERSDIRLEVFVCRGKRGALD